MISFLQPRDPRWQGPQRWYFAIDLFKNTILLFFLILIIVETSLHRKWYNSYYSTVEYDSNETISDFFVRIGIALIADFLSVVLTHSLLPSLRFHPVYALTQSLVVFCLYPSILTLNAIVVYADETSADYISVWRRLCYAEMGLQAVLTICWMGLVGCSCVAVHRMRRERLRGVIREEMELKGVAGRRDSTNVDVERGGLVGGVAKSERVFV